MLARCIGGSGSCVRWAMGCSSEMTGGGLLSANAPPPLAGTFVTADLPAANLGLIGIAQSLIVLGQCAHGRDPRSGSGLLFCKCSKSTLSKRLHTFTMGSPV